MKSKFFSGEGHGKLILTGEHSVVYGHPAIAVGITTKTTVQLHPLRGPSQLDPSASDHRLEQVVSTLLPNGYRIRIHSALPTGRGMGSSAALSVALVRARAQAQGHDLSPDELFEQAMKAERIFHTMPSGLDALVSGQGGVVYFEKGEPPRTESLPQPKWSIIVLDSGHSGNTSAMVKQVAAQRPAVNQTLAAIGDLSRAAKKQLADVTVLGELLTENHRLLSQLGVSTPELDSLVKVALDAGAAGAKLSGAGGGGVVIAVTADPEAVLSRVLRRNINGFTCTIWSDKDEECKLQP